MHVTDAEVARRYVRGWDERARALAQAFWPGPLTLVLAKTAAVPDIVTAGGDTVAVRAPNHPVAQAILQAFGGPLAAPSANRSTSISPTTAAAVEAELRDRIELIVDGGPCEVGLESTVVDLTGPAVTVLRPGRIEAGQLEAVLGDPVRRSAGLTGEVARSPGLMRRHYAPRTPVRLVRAAQLGLGWDPAVAYLTFTVDLPPGVLGRRLPPGPAEYARELYGALRWADGLAASELWVELPPEEEPWAAIRDRLERASDRG